MSFVERHSHRKNSGNADNGVLDSEDLLTLLQGFLCETFFYQMGNSVLQMLLLSGKRVVI